MSCIKIELPNLKYKDSFLAGMREFSCLDSECRYAKYAKSMSDEEFEKEVVQPKLEAMTGKGLPEGWVPSTVFWIIQTDTEEYVGRIDLRHSLTESLRTLGGHIGYDIVPSKRGKGYVKAALRLVLEEAHKMGIEQVLITCDEDNEPSRRTIAGAFQEYGGKEDVMLKDNDKNKLRFWINARKA